MDAHRFPLRVLIFDDKPENPVVLRQVPAGTQAEIVAATNGNNALAATRPRQPLAHPVSRCLWLASAIASGKHSI